MWQKKLEEYYPETCSDIYCGAHVGEGWQPRVEQAIRELESMVTRKNKIKVAQIKEKFGGLRLYIDRELSNDPDETFSNKAYAIVKSAEADCWKICKICGDTKDIQQQGPIWNRTRCIQCAKGQI